MFVKLNFSFTFFLVFLFVPMDSCDILVALLLFQCIFASTTFFMRFCQLYYIYVSYIDLTVQLSSWYFVKLILKAVIKGIFYDYIISFVVILWLHAVLKWQPTPVFLPGESQGQRSPVGCRLWGCTESDMTEAT